jgi:hypothetical protein
MRNGTTEESGLLSTVPLHFYKLLILYVFLLFRDGKPERCFQARILRKKALTIAGSVVGLSHNRP